jgi:serine phosphatase RsbU (regulator of sigma subunit)
MDEPRTIIPLVRDIMTPQREIPPSMKVCEVVEVFRADLSLRVLPLVEDGRCVGLVSRKNLFFRHLSRKFASDLFSNKPIAVLKDENPVLMEPQLDSTNALTRLLETDPLLETDSFLIVEGARCLGVVTVSDLMMRISESQRNLLDTLRTLSARIREEVAHASRIQQELLPDPAFRFNGLSIAAGITTSTEIGGDFYDYFRCGDNRLGLIIADVSGHGVQSGMVTTAAKASLHTLLSSGVSTPAELLSGMNRAIIATARRRLLMTCFIAVIDTEKERLDYANAGHNFPYLYQGQSGELDLLQEASGFPLGFDEGAEFPEYTTEFVRGDSLVLYTDGIVECRGGNDEEFGYERMERLIRTEIRRAPDEVVDALLEGAREFAGTCALEDDATVLVASFTR